MVLPDPVGDRLFTLNLSKLAGSFAATAEELKARAGASGKPGEGESDRTRARGGREGSRDDGHGRERVPGMPGFVNPLRFQPRPDRDPFAFGSGDLDPLGLGNPGMHVASVLLHPGMSALGRFFHAA